MYQILWNHKAIGSISYKISASISLATKAINTNSTMALKDFQLSMFQYDIHVLSSKYNNYVGIEAANLRSDGQLWGVEEKEN